MWKILHFYQKTLKEEPLLKFGVGVSLKTVLYFWSKSRQRSKGAFDVCGVT
jgi:hypothetical protein